MGRVELVLVSVTAVVAEIPGPNWLPARAARGAEAALVALIPMRAEATHADVECPMLQSE
mgnify:CR=1 FL=1